MRDRSLLPLKFVATVTGPEMPLVSRKGVLAIAAVIDVAINASARPVSAKALAARHRLPPRHLEPVLQALVRDGILKGIRGPHGGYELARERNSISADDILRAADTVEDGEALPLPGSALVNDVVRPALAETERSLSVALGRINVDDMVKRAAMLK
jgi:Rrf2 family iron-sulfur cluster assembly transcriptional regulator